MPGNLNVSIRGLSKDGKFRRQIPITGHFAEGDARMPAPENIQNSGRVAQMVRAQL